MQKSLFTAYREIRNMRNHLKIGQPDQISFADKFLFRSLTYFKSYVANFDVPSGLIFAILK